MKTKKTILNLSVIIITLMFIVACKKKKEPEPAPVPAPIAAHVNSMTAKINGVDWAMGHDQWGAYSVVSKSGNNFGFSGQTDVSAIYSSLSANFTYTTGIVPLAKWTSFTMRYKDVNNNYLTSVTGTLNITSLDSLGIYGLPKKMKATFSFKTDTVAGTSYNVTDGVIDYESN